MKPIPPKYLILSGGGVKVVSIVGAIKALDAKGLLTNLKEVSGVSAGGWLAFMISAGLSIQTIESLVLGFEFGHIRNLNPEALMSFPETLGLDDGINLMKFLESIFRIAIKISPTVTFAEFDSLNLSKIKFRCWATDLKECTTCEFSLETTPHVRIIEALRSSMALPLYFTPMKHPITGNMLSDGGIQGSLPIHALTDAQRDKCIAIGFAHGVEKKNPSDIMSFMAAIFSCLIHSRHETILTKWDSSIIKIPIYNTASWDFEISREQRLALVKNGYDAGLAWISNKYASARKILRRHSLQ
jgi:predicted acylesterase/phospholipase RssA